VNCYMNCTLKNYIRYIKIKVNKKYKIAYTFESTMKALPGSAGYYLFLLHLLPHAVPFGASVEIVVTYISKDLKKEGKLSLKALH